MICIYQYRKEVKDGMIYIRSEEESACPFCQSVLQVIGSRKRKVIEADGTKQAYILRRLRCKKCKPIHHELPDCLIPYKSHCADTIETAISNTDISDENNPISRSTKQRIKQWWNIVSIYFTFIISALEHRHGIRLNMLTRPR